MACGSPGYVAPEVLNEEGYGVQSDVFSAGVIFYVMLTGRPVFSGAGCDQAEILKANTECKVEFPDRYWKNISQEARDLVEKMLIRDQDERITAKEALLHPWFENSSDDERLLNRDDTEFNK